MGVMRVSGKEMGFVCLNGKFMIFCMYLTPNYFIVKAWSLCVAAESAFYSPFRQRTCED